MTLPVQGSICVSGSTSAVHRVVRVARQASLASLAPLLAPLLMRENDHTAVRA
jgi:hypothetical protein